MVYTKHGEIYQQIRWASDRGKPFGLKGANNQIASLNFNIDELGCAVGRVQIKKLPEIVSKRRNIVKKMRDKFSSLKSIEIPEEKAGAEASYWFLITKFNNDAVTCSKDEFLDAVREEGISPIVNNYTQNQPYKMDWCQKKQVFGNSGYPWASPEYKGNPDAEYPCPNTELVSKSYFNIYFNESWTDEEINDCFEAFKKVETYYAK
jgi:dTDP-4-amino-4,6-dideoxygalactose transaminase